MRRPKISFLLCTRIRAPAALACVQELLASPRDDFEIIVRDNCSTDNTRELLEGVNDRRLHVYVAPVNQGTLTFFECARLASGELVTWISDEESFEMSSLDFVVVHFGSNAESIVLFGGIVVGRV